MSRNYSDKIDCYWSWGHWSGAGMSLCLALEVHIYGGQLFSDLDYHIHTHAHTPTHTYAS